MDVYNNLFTFRPAPVNRLAARSFSNAGRPAVISPRHRPLPIPFPMPLRLRPPRHPRRFRRTS